MTFNRKKFFDLLLWTPKGHTGKFARYYNFHSIGAWVACFSHASWIIVFALNENWFMAYYNAVVTVMFATYAFLWHRRQGPMWFIHFLYFVEVPIHALLGTLYTGFTTMFWMFSLLPSLVCLLTPHFSWPRKTAICAALLIYTCGIGVWAILLSPWSPVSQGWVIYLFISNTISISIAFVVYLGINQHLVETAELGLKNEFDRAEGLLRNILPDSIALRLKDGERLIANEHQEVSVIFADIVGFTEASSKLSAIELIETLNLAFSEFDTLSDNHGAEKIKTIGDAYMAVVGVPEAKSNHAEIAVDLALDMLAKVKEIEPKTHFKVQLRLGVNSGPVVAGVIGKRKFTYDLWGDAVNMASRMESLSAPGQIMITEDTAKLLPDRFSVTSRGIQEVKGKGKTRVFSVEVPRP